MGAKLAAPKKLCVNVMGDAAIGMTGMDIETAARNRIAILTVVFNNGVMAAERDVLERLLTYGPRAQQETEDSRGESLLVVPREGTISPWSSKATDIARVCGLEVVRRIERGITHTISQTLPKPCLEPCPKMVTALRCSPP